LVTKVEKSYILIYIHLTKYATLTSKLTTMINIMHAPKAGHIFQHLVASCVGLQLFPNKFNMIDSQ